MKRCKFIKALENSIVAMFSFEYNSCRILEDCVRRVSLYQHIFLHFIVPNPDCSLETFKEIKTPDVFCFVTSDTIHSKPQTYSTLHCSNRNKIVINSFYSVSQLNITMFTFTLFVYCLSIQCLYWINK